MHDLLVAIAFVVMLLFPAIVTTIPKAETEDDA